VTGRDDWDRHAGAAAIVRLTATAIVVVLSACGSPADRIADEPGQVTCQHAPGSAGYAYYVEAGEAIKCTNGAEPHFTPGAPY
jgi:hypothetical protein